MVNVDEVSTKFDENALRFLHLFRWVKAVKQGSFVMSCMSMVITTAADGTFLPPMPIINVKTTPRGPDGTILKNMLANK